MTNRLKKCQLFLVTLSLAMLFSVTIVIAQEGLLDGKVFVGQAIEKHKRAVKEDELRFMSGEFNSIKKVLTKPYILLEQKRVRFISRLRM